LQAAGVADGDQYVAGTHVDGIFGDLGVGVEAEFLGFLSFVLMAAAVVDFGALEDDEEADGEGDAGDGGHLNDIVIAYQAQDARKGAGRGGS
jgi:hypothetical protein